MLVAIFCLAFYLPGQCFIRSRSIGDCLVAKVAPKSAKLFVSGRKALQVLCDEFAFNIISSVASRSQFDQTNRMFIVELFVFVELKVIVRSKSVECFGPWRTRHV